MFIFNKQIFPILCVCFLYDKDSLFHMSDASKSAARENDEEIRQVKDDFFKSREAT